MTEFKGAMTQQYVCQQFRPKFDLYYWANDNGAAEVDFLFQKNNKIIPLEVKAEENAKAKSLKLFSDIYNITPSYRASMNAYREQEWMQNIPLYSLGFADF